MQAEAVSARLKDRRLGHQPRTAPAPWSRPTAKAPSSSSCRRSMLLFRADKGGKL